MASNRALVAVLDDEPEVRRGLQRFLRSAGFAVEVYASGDEFLGACAAHVPDCLVLDLHMPERNGFDVQVELTRSGANIPVVVITGNDSAASRARALANGASAYLCKPVDGATLLDAIEDAIANRVRGPPGDAGTPGGRSA